MPPAPDLSKTPIRSCFPRRPRTVSPIASVSRWLLRVMNNHNWLRRSKRRVLKTIRAAGFEVEKSEDWPGYLFRRRGSFGHHHLADIRRITHNRVQTVLDIGADVGQTALDFAETFSEACIYSLEPDPDSFRELCANTRHESRIHPIRVAAGERLGQATLFRNRFSQTNSLLEVDADSRRYLVSESFVEPLGAATVSLTTIDNFCQERSIAKLDLLKTDTQGNELRVLEGAAGMLAEHRIALIYLEVCFVPFYKDQALFSELYDHLFNLGYRLVGLYEGGYSTRYYQVGCNALFVEETLGRRTP